MEAMLQKAVQGKVEQQKLFTKFKYSASESFQKKNIDNIAVPTAGVEGNAICGNKNWVAFPIKSPGGILMVHPSDFTGKLDHTAMNHTIQAHTGPIQDCDFSPFHENIVATCSTDGSLKMFVIPDGGVNSQIKECDSEMVGHSKKVSCFKFNPTVEFTLASASTDQSIKVWDIQNQSSAFSYDQLGEQPWNIDWNWNGSMVGCSTKGKKVHILDPRQAESAQVFPGHASSKGQKMKFFGANRPHNLMTCGFSEFNDRQYAIYDDRKVQEPLTIQKLDAVSNVGILNYDDSINTLYVTDKGSRSWHTWYFTDCDGPKFTKIESSNNQGNTLGLYFLPKKDIDTTKNELNRIWRITGTGQAEQFSFKVPRRGAGFSEEIYPPCLANEFSNTYEEWEKGENKDPIFKPFCAVTANAQNEGDKQLRASTLGAKLAGGKPPANGGFHLKKGAFDPHAETPVVASGKEKELQAQIDNLSKELQSAQAQIKSMETQIQEQDGQIQDKVGTISNLQQQLEDKANQQPTYSLNDQEDDNDHEQPTAHDERDNQIKEGLASFGQEHVLAHLDQLTAEQKESLYDEIMSIDLHCVQNLHQDLVLGQAHDEARGEIDRIEEDLTVDASELAEMGLFDKGLELIKNGEVACVILAGGQGSRLGFDHPKGMYDIGLKSKKSIFQILSERFLRAQMLAHGTETLTDACQTCKLMIMTSGVNHEETYGFFKENNFFGGNESSFVFFSQSSLPAVDPEGKIIMKSPHEIQLAPNGNGALFDSIKNNQMVAGLIEAVKYVQVIGVDNVLNKILDPVQVGFMSENQLDASLKVCVKCDAAEKVGVVCKKNGKYDIVEYSELSEEESTRTAPDGSLFLELGSILIFMLSAEKLLNLASNTETLNKLYHVAHKKLEHWSEDENKTVKPDQENGYKFELFLHNFLPFVGEGKFGAIKVAREEEFGPVKNADGAATDTPAIARQLIQNQHAKWANAAGHGDKFEGLTVEVDLLKSYHGEGADLQKALDAYQVTGEDSVYIE